MGFTATTCPACKGDIQVPDDRDAAKCMLCGHNIDVASLRGSAPDTKLDNLMQLAAAARESGNQDEAYGYFSRVLEADSKNAEAWFGKAAAAGWSGNLRRDRYPELVKGMEKAIEHAAGDQAAMRERAADEIRKVTVAYFRLSRDHTTEFIALDNTWEEHIQRCINMLDALKKAHEFDPSNQAVLRNGIDLTKSMLDGVWFEDKYNDDNIETKTLPPSLEQHAGQIRDEFVSALQKLDPSYKAASITKAGGEFTLTGCLGCLLVLGVVGGVAWLLVSKFVLQ